MSADMLASVASTASAMAATAALRRAAVPPPLDAPLPLAANFLLDCEAPGHWGYLHLLAAAEKGDEAKAIWLLETLKVAPDARPDAHAPVAPGDRRSVLVAAGRLRWAVEEGATPLMVASRPPRTLPGVIRALLANGADPGLRDFHSWTALLRAAWNGREDAVRTLLQGVESRGRRVASDPDEKDRGGWTAVMRAAWNAHLPALRALLPHNPPLDARDRYGQTALILAASLGHADIVRALLEAGADPAHRDDKGQDAAAAARARGHDAAAKVLEEWAARPAATGRRVTSIYAEELPEDHLIRKPPAPAAGVPGAFVDPEPPAAQVESTPTPTPTPTATTSDPELPSDLAALHPAGDSIPPSCHAQLPPLLSELLRPRPALDAVLSRFASFERAGGEVREGVVRRMEGVRYLKEEIAAFASFAAGRAALAEKFASLQHAAEADAAARAGEVQALEEARGKLEKEAEQARGELEGLRARLVELEGSLGLPGSAAEGVHAARGEAERAFASRAAEMDAEAAVKKRELAGAERTAALAGALMTRAAEEAAALGDDGAALGRELAAAEQRHAGYLRELVARSLRVLHAIRRGLEQAGDDAAMALEVRHFRCARPGEVADVLLRRWACRRGTTGSSSRTAGSRRSSRRRGGSRRGTSAAWPSWTAPRFPSPTPSPRFPREARCGWRSPRPRRRFPRPGPRAVRRASRMPCRSARRRTAPRCLRPRSRSRRRWSRCRWSTSSCPRRPRSRATTRWPPATSPRRGPRRTPTGRTPRSSGRSWRRRSS
ncbi:hypothetical protein DFJ74DRAFT_656004 [Hyaloraphidium curvatum]|nr:hypothetical protein DFJ74DRAFT_656004 [Hyaloraphidium curvatum]